MIFEALSESADRGELILVEGGYCRYRRRRDGDVTIREILVLPALRGKGIGSGMLAEVRRRHPRTPLVARCPADLPANAWYERRGFVLLSRSHSASGREINGWRLYAQRG